MIGVSPYRAVKSPLLREVSKDIEIDLMNPVTLGQG